jgi:tRNA nucleotidyltransferase (CCA-adding enzyme)
MNATQIIKKLEDNNFQGFIVGGAVRDQILGFTPKDIDVATDARPEEVMALFANSKKVGAHFPVVLVDGIVVATFRTETAARGRHDVDFEIVHDIKDDLGRRDFTMNAMALDSKGNLVDPYRGRQDMKAGVIKFVGAPDVRIAEDPLRMLRLVRFAVRFDFEIDSFTKMVIRQRGLHNLLKKVSNERIRR